jgi:hypothetical protein
LVHPGRGERILAGTDECEMFFSFPAKDLELFVDGLEKTHKKGTRYPIQSYMIYQPPVIPPVKTLDEKLRVTHYFPSRNSSFPQSLRLPPEMLAQ